jgi:hypothetical protein
MFIGTSVSLSLFTRHIRPISCFLHISSRNIMTSSCNGANHAISRIGILTCLPFHFSQNGIQMVELIFPPTWLPTLTFFLKTLKFQERPLSGVCEDLHFFPPLLQTKVGYFYNECDLAIRHLIVLQEMAWWPPSDLFHCLHVKNH